MERRLSDAQSRQRVPSGPELVRARERERDRMVNLLMVKTEFREEQIVQQFAQFMHRCPDGALTKV